MARINYKEELLAEYLGVSIDSFRKYKALSTIVEETFRSLPLRDEDIKESFYKNNPLLAEVPIAGEIVFKPFPRIKENASF